MIATTKLRLTDLGRQRRLETDLRGRLTPGHTVGEALDLFLEETGLGERGGRFAAFSRGLRLDAKARLADLSEEASTWTVMPEVSAG